MKSRTPAFSRCRVFVLGALAAFSTPFLAAQNAQTVYSADFANNAGQGRSFASVGWTAYTGAEATVIKIASRLATISAGTGTDGGTGYIWSSFKKSDSPLLFTHKASLDGISLAAGSYAVSFDAVQEANVARVQVAIELNGGDWYVSNTQFTPPRSGSGSFDVVEASQYHFVLPLDLAASGWSHLVLKPGTELAVGAALTEPLPQQGVITNIGLLLTNVHGSWAATVRIDNLKVNKR